MRIRVRAALIVLSSVLVTAACGDGSTPTTPVEPISIETASLDDAIEGQAYSQQLAASGGSGGYSWVLAAGSLPAGLTLAPAGAISGTAIAPGTSNFRIRATDGEGNTATADLSIEVIQSLAVHTWLLHDAMVGEDYSAQLQAVGGRGTHEWSMVGGEAAWLEISVDGQLSGTPDQAEAVLIEVAVSDQSGQEATRQLAITVLDPLSVAAMALPAATEGRMYAVQLVATGGDGIYTWSLEGGTLPAGMELVGGGALIGIPGEAGAYTFSARVTDGADRVAARTFTLTVERAPTIQTTSLPPGSPGEAYGAQLVATGGTGAYSWSLDDGALPPGLTLAGNGAISGTPTAEGSATFTVRVTDEASVSHTRTFTIVIAEIEALSSGVPVTDLAGAAESVRYFAIEVPTGATQLTVSISEGTGDVDLYIRRAALPAQFAYDCRPLRQGNEETCTVTSPTAGYWYIMLRGHADYAGVTLVATHDE